MNITELDSYNLADAVQFNDELNPAIWSGQKMKPKVREHLLAIALQADRPKDRERVIKILDEARIDKNYLERILKKFDLH